MASSLVTCHTQRCRLWVNWMSEQLLVERLETLLSRLSSRRGVRHVVLGASSMQGDWRWSGAVGDASSGVAMHTETPWFLASVTKLYVTSIVMLLQEDGLVDLEAPVAEYLPGEITEGLHVIDGVDYTEQITPLHLLGHSSGLPDSLDERPAGEPSLIERALDEGDRAWSLEEAIAHAKDRLTPHFPPSDPASDRPRIRYSDTNFQLLMMMAEEVAGGSISEIYRRRIFSPLGLRHTWLPGTDPIEPTARPASVWLGDKDLMARPNALRSSKDLFSTVDDVLGFGRALFTGQVFHRASTVERLWRRFNRFGFPLGAAALRAPSWPIEYGLGVMRFAVGRLLAGGMRIPPVIGHTGSTGSWLWYCPQLSLLLAGTVDQGKAVTAPFRLVPRALANPTALEA